ncbi:mitochondrial proton/calcium exchanger protein [Prorops nasuta]|uniref:mitochondrial proton/calcium exchanger protein n=1 Tax=Prorops nasuta TaxID=863751 RepID=UPI0034CDFC64
MNSLIYSKMMVTRHGSTMRRCNIVTWYNTRQMYEGTSLISMSIRDSNTKKLLKDSVLHETYPSSNAYSPIRTFYMTPTWNGQEPSSKIEETVKSIKEEKESKEKIDKTMASSVAASPEKTVAEKRTILQKIKGEILHYYHGFRLLGLDMKVSAKLIWRVLQGKELTRREHRLLVKTTGNLFRLIPFSVFIIVPFMELLLPVAIKLFPGLLPSTFQTATEKEDKLKQALKVKIEMAKFLQKTLGDMAVQSTDHRSEKAKEFADFFHKVRTTGAVASNEEIIKFSKLFEDEITLDSLSRPQLIALCRVLDVQTLGTSNFLRFLLRMKLRSLAADDKLIDKEGIDSLTRSELQQACRARGMRAYGMPESRLKEQLAQWLDLSLNQKVPPSLLLLSRALMVPETIPMSDKLKATISALPDAVAARTKAAIGEKEGKMDHKTEIELIKLEEKRIEEEREEEKEVTPPKTILAAEPSKKDEITSTDVKAIEQALESIGKEKKQMAVEKEELKELKEEMAEYQEDIQELYQIKAEAKGQEDIENIKVSKGAKRLFNKVNKMINKMDAVLLELEQSEKKVKEKIEALGEEKSKDNKAIEELVKIDELIAAIKKIQNVPDEFRLARISEILGKIDGDRDGAIKIEDVLKVVELIGKEDVKLSKKQVDELIDLIDKEEVLEIEEQLQKKQKELLKETDEQMPKLDKTSAKDQKADPEELKDGYKSINSYSNQDEDLEKTREILKPTTESVKKETLTPGVPPTTKKSEGSKQL